MTCRTILLLILLASVSSWASESYTPPEGGEETWQRATVYLKGAGPFRAAKGASVFACNLAETQHRCQIYAKGLRPGALHTLWIVDTKDGKITYKYQLTSRLRPLRADRRGVLYFIGSLPWCPMSHDQLLVRYHPVSGNRNFNDGITVLVGNLATMQ